VRGFITLANITVFSSLSISDAKASAANIAWYAAGLASGFTVPEPYAAPSLRGPTAYAALAAAGGFSVADLAVTSVSTAYSSSAGSWSVVASLNVTVCLCCVVNP
jgi:hypothetical protein